MGKLEKGGKRVPAMKDLALGNHAMVDMGSGVKGQSNGNTSESTEKVLEEMKFQEIVKENYPNHRKRNYIMRNGNQTKGTEYFFICIEGRFIP